EEGAQIIHDRLEKKGVEVITETECVDFEGGENVEKVITGSGEEFDCDAVAVAIGQEPNSEIIDAEKNEAGMLKVDEHLSTSEEDVFAAGNMVEYYSPVFERRTVNGSWDHSEAMGETAALNMLDEQEKFDYVNTYGVGHFDVQFLAIGDWSGEPVARKYDTDHYRRLFFDGDRLIGAVLIGYTKGQEELRRMIADKKEFEDGEKLLEKDFWES
ncbi:MAG: FAD-dependent oxidoreductase, partial [Candidatus Nanohaloarchaea archaeon]